MFSTLLWIAFIATFIMFIGVIGEWILFILEFIFELIFEGVEVLIDLIAKAVHGKD